MAEVDLDGRGSWPGTGEAIACFVLTVVCLHGGSVLLTRGPSIVWQLTAVQLATLGLVPFVWLRLRGLPVMLPGLRPGLSAPGLILRSLVLVPATWILVLALERIVGDGLGLPPHDMGAALRAHGIAGLSPGLVLAICLVPALLEEFLVRGLVLESFLARGATAAGTLVSALLFAAMHLYPRGFVPLFVMGVVLAVLVRRSGSLAAAMAVHFGHNLISLVLLFPPAGWPGAPQVDRLFAPLSHRLLFAGGGAALVALCLRGWTPRRADDPTDRPRPDLPRRAGAVVLLIPILIPVLLPALSPGTAWAIGPDRHHPALVTMRLRKAIREVFANPEGLLDVTGVRLSAKDEVKTRKVLRRFFGKSELRGVSFPGYDPEAFAAHRFPRVDIELAHLNLMGLDVDGATLELTDLRIDGPLLHEEGRIRLGAPAKLVLKVRVSEASLNRYLRNHRVRCTPGYFGIRGTAHLLVVPIPYRLDGRLVADERNCIWFRGRTMSLGFLPIPAAIRKAILAKVNPIFDIDDFLGSARRVLDVKVEELAMLQDRVTMRATGFIHDRDRPGRGGGDDLSSEPRPGGRHPSDLLRESRESRPPREDAPTRRGCSSDR